MGILSTDTLGDTLSARPSALREHSKAVTSLTQSRLLVKSIVLWVCFVRFTVN